MGKKLKIALFLPAAAVIVFLAVYLLLLRPDGPKGYVESTGVMEATEVNLSPKISGRIEWLCCEEGGKVEAGALAMRLESAELLARVEEGRAALAAAGEALAEARVSLENAMAAKESAGFEVEAARANADRYSALTEEAKGNLSRAEGLFKDGFIPKKELDAARAAYDANAALLASAGAEFKGAGARLRNAEAGIKAARARISSAEARKQQAGAQLKVLESVLSDARVHSPIDGVVAYKAFETGEFAASGAPVYTVYDLKDIWARADIEETAIRKIRLGGRAEVRAAGDEKVFEAKVTEIGEVGGFATQRDVTRGRPDIKTFRVKAAIIEPEGFLKPGMTVELRIYTAGPERAE